MYIKIITYKDLVMKKIYLFFIFFCLMRVFSQKQVTEQQIDSIRLTIKPSFNNEELAQLTELYYKSKEIDYTKGKISTLKRIASIEAGNSNYDKAFIHLKEMKALAISANDYKSYILGSCTESSIYSSDKNYNHALKILNNANKYVDKIENLEERRKTKIAIYSNKSFVFFNSKLPANSYSDSIISLSKKVYAEALLVKDEPFRNQNIFTSCLFIAICYIKKDQLNNARRYLNITTEQIKKQNPGGFGMAEYYEALGDFEYKNKKDNKNYLDSALANYNRSIKESLSIDYTGLLKKLYPKVAIIYRDKKDVVHQSEFLEKSSNLNDSLETKQNRNLNAVKQNIYEIKNHDELEPEKNKQRLLYIVGIIIMIILVGLLYFYVITSRNKKNTTHPTLEKNKNDSEAIIEKQDSINKPSVSYYIHLLQENNSSFYLQFLENHPCFREKLLKINPTLKSSDIEFCAYIKLNLETKQIAQLKKTSVRAVEGKKYRIRKKLNIAAEENMYIWMSKV